MYNRQPIHMCEPCDRLQTYTQSVPYKERQPSLISEPMDNINQNEQAYHRNCVNQ